MELYRVFRDISVQCTCPTGSTACHVSSTDIHRSPRAIWQKYDSLINPRLIRTLSGTLETLIQSTRPV